MRWPWTKEPWWCGGGHLVTRHDSSYDNPWTHPELHHEKFCGSLHMETELGKKRDIDRMRADLPYVREFARIRARRDRFIRDNFKVSNLTMEGRCDRCTAPLQLRVGATIVTRIDGSDPDNMVWVDITAKVLWPSETHVCEEVTSP